MTGRTEQERDLLRAFRARLFDVQTELEREKNRSGEGAAVRQLVHQNPCVTPCRMSKPLLTPILWPADMD